MRGLRRNRNTLSTPDERDELQERDSSVRADLDLLFQLVNLLIIDQDHKTVAVEGLDRLRELLLRIDPAPARHFEAV
jgi:hypothetical protein